MYYKGPAHQREIPVSFGSPLKRNSKLSLLSYHCQGNS
jgi:hypothetical protein